ncbi:MAG: thymidylate synthase [Oscillospiraceae bacterium]|nr:thymidylate synthase [Oscillospiraceae bacterium]
MSKFDDAYLDLCERIINNGTLCPNRTGTDSKKLTHEVLRFDLEQEFPILTSKSVGFKSSVLEMLWIYQVQSNDVRWLQDRGISIWDEWEADENGNYKSGNTEKNLGKEFAHTIGTAYGWIVKKYKLTQNLINMIKNNPTDRRMIMSLWQDEYMPTAVLPSCVWNTQWDVTDDKLNCIVTQRSCDVPLGLPYNVSQYATLVHLIAHVTGLKAGKMTFVINNAHIYSNQFDGIREQISRKDQCLAAPKLWINPEIKDFFEFDNSKELKDIKLIDYQHLGKISMPVSV